VLFLTNAPKTKGRLIERSQYADVIKINADRNNYEIYRRRQAIVEHYIWCHQKTMGLLLYYDQENH
jgi:hypothetical protein